MSQSVTPGQLSRRRFMAGAAGAGLFSGAFQALALRDVLAQTQGGRPPRAALNNGGYGHLFPLTRSDPDFGEAVTLFLPAGFDFAVLSAAGRIMSDGNFTPFAFDGMASFPGPQGTVRLVRNHEERTPSAFARPSGSPGKRYDPLGGGGTSTLQIAFDAQGVPYLERDWMSISGTIVNCAGGPTPWGSWLTCEEITDGTLPFRPDTQGRPFRGSRGWGELHGYVFDVPAGLDEEVDPVPLKAMGRFVHEAVCVDPRTGIVYETEDRGTGGIYRFIPDVPDDVRFSFRPMDGRRAQHRQGRRRGARPVPQLLSPGPRRRQANGAAVLRVRAVRHQGRDGARRRRREASA
jgi:uncharacterized protein